MWSFSLFCFAVAIAVVPLGHGLGFTVALALQSPRTPSCSGGCAPGLRLGLLGLRGDGLGDGGGRLRIIAVGPWSSQVMLITDEKAGAGAVVGQLGQSGAMVWVRGRADLNVALIEMRYVSGLEKVEVGDSVMTTGQDGIYPAGLNIGKVVDVKTGTATQAHQILIQPGAQLDQLEEVAVLLYTPRRALSPNRLRMPKDRGDKVIADGQLAMFICRSLRLP